MRMFRWVPVPPGHAGGTGFRVKAKPLFSNPQPPTPNANRPHATARLQNPRGGGAALRASKGCAGPSLREGPGMRGG